MFLKSGVAIKHQDLSSDDFIFISTVLKVHLDAGLFMSWGEKEKTTNWRDECYFFFLKKT